MELPKLYHKGKKSELRVWRTWAEGPYIYTEHGVLNGQLQISRKQAIAKNVGRANATTPEQQAILECKALHKYKLDRKYSETPEAAQAELFLPMLAHTFKGTKRSKFCYAGWIQPKLDGCRSLASRDENGNIQLTSRSGKLWNIPHIQEALNKWLPSDAVLDGEIYIHGMSCQAITSLIKSASPSSKSFKPESIKLEYHVYDVPLWEGDDTLPWQDRLHVLLEIQNYEGIKIVDSHPVRDEDEVFKYQTQFVQEGYEGAIVRAANGLYLWGYRSSDLLKVKEFEDAEFTVIGVKEGRGKMEGHAVWICQNNLTSETFDCTMKGSMDMRRQTFEECDQYIGKRLTVRFFGLTDDGKPRFPVGIVFRNEIDLS